MKKEPTKIERGSPEWDRRVLELLRSFAPPVQQCQKCTHPVVQGYCCTSCGTGTPESTQAEDDAWEAKYRAKK